MTTGRDMGLGVRPGDVLAGKYRVERVLGVGGMGVVLAAHHLALDERVALKFLLPETLQNPEAVARFVREARAAVRIKSEHVARVADVGQLETGAPYMVMEFLEGGDLAEWLRQKGPLPIELAVDFVLQACVAVADAHALGIIHRDLKPANLFCVRRSDGQLTVKVLDFGISKMSNLASAGAGVEMTRTSALMGSPLYMSPEQMRSSKDVDAGTDIWALGVILFELLSGKQPFSADTVTELAIKVSSEAPLPLRGSRPDLPLDLEAVVLKCLEKKRSDRYRHVGELALALLPFAPKRAKASVDRIVGIVQAAGLIESPLSEQPRPNDPAPAPGETLRPLGRTTIGGKRKGAALGVAALLGALVLGGGVTMAVRLRRPPPPPADPRAAGSAPMSPLPASAQASASVVIPEPQPPALPSAAASSQASPPSAPTASGRPPGAPLGAASKSARPAPLAHAAGSADRAASAPDAPPAPAHSHETKVSCDPPYYFDAHGNRAFKPECM